MKSKGFNAHSKYMILKHAMKENNVSRTCELFGISRTIFYKWQGAYQMHGMIGLEGKEPQKPVMPNKVSKAMEQEILSYVVKYPADGPKRIYYELRAEGFNIGETGIYNVLKRYNLTKKAQRVEYSLNKSLLTKNSVKNNKEVPVFLNTEKAYPGYLVIQRIEFIGSFDGIGKIYQYSFYDTVSKWVTLKLYNKKQDIDIWNFFELKLSYLLKMFNLNIENLVTEKDKTFLPYIVKSHKYKEIIEEFHIKHRFISRENNPILDDMRDFNEYLVREFYSKIPSNKEIDSFIKVERALNNFVKHYNFYNVISSGNNAGKTPAEVVLKRATENKADLDTLPLWLLALINSSRGRDKDE